MSFRRTIRYNSFHKWKREAVDDLGDVIDLTDCTIKVMVKPFLTNEDGVLPDARAWVNFAATLLEETSGTYQFALTPAETSLPPGTYPAEIRRWRAPDAPTVACGDALAGAGAGNVENGVHLYWYSYVSPYGESDLSPVSDGVTVADKTVNGKVSLTAIAVGPAGTTARKLWRTIAGGAAALALATISDNTTVIYEDNIADGSLGAAHAVVISTTPPPEDVESGEVVVEEAVEVP